MPGRTGPFWDGVEGRAPLPRAAAILYDTVGPALLATLEPDQFQSTLQLNVRFLRPVRPGRLLARGRIVHRDGDLVFLEAVLSHAVIPLRDASAAA
jgi:hypothetical protein